MKRSLAMTLPAFAGMTGILCAFTLILQAESKQKSFGEEPLAMTLEAYVTTVLKQSDRALTAFNNYENAVFSNKVSYRQTRLPQLNVTSSASKSKTNRDEVITELNQAQGQATLSQPLYPTGARLSATVSETATLSESRGNESNAYTRPAYSASITQPLFLFVGNADWRTWKRAKASYDIAKENFKRELLSIENAARSRYYNVLLKAAQLDVEKAKLESSKRATKITEALVNAGRLAGIELTRSETRLKKDQRRLVGVASGIGLQVVPQRRLGQGDGVRQPLGPEFVVSAH